MLGSRLKHDAMIGSQGQSTFPLSHCKLIVVNCINLQVIFRGYDHVTSNILNVITF